MSAGRISKTGARRKEARLHLTTSETVKDMIRLAASLEGVSMSAFVLKHANEAAQHVIEREARVELGEGASLQVAEALARPARALPVLVDLFRE